MNQEGNRDDIKAKAKELERAVENKGKETKAEGQAKVAGAQVGTPLRKETIKFDQNPPSLYHRRVCGLERIR